MVSRLNNKKNLMKVSNSFFIPTDASQRDLDRAEWECLLFQSLQLQQSVKCISVEEGQVAGAPVKKSQFQSSHPAEMHLMFGRFSWLWTSS